ncbi:MAG: AsmA-like C-terminal region-containing protein [Thermodesulfobacteriota bacterium]
MRIVFRIFLIGLAAAAVILAGAAVLIFLLPETDLIRARVEQELERATGRKVVLGPVKVSAALPTLVSVTVAGVSVQTTEGQPLFSAEKVVLKPRLMSLLQREFAIDSASIERFSVTLSGSSSDRSPQPPGPAPASVGTADTVKEKQPESVAQPQESAAAAPAGSATDQRRGSILTIKNLTFSEGNLRIAQGHQDSRDKAETVLRGIGGSLKQDTANQPIKIECGFYLGPDTAMKEPAKLSGWFATAPDYSRVEQGELRVLVESLSISNLKPYVPAWADKLAAFKKVKIDAGLDVNKSQRDAMDFRAEITPTAAGSGGIAVSGTLLAKPPYSGIDNLRWKGEVRPMPLKELAEILPEALPLDRNAGEFQGSFEGDWNGSEAWRIKGSLNLENGAPAGKLAVVGKPLHVRSAFTLEPELLEVHNAELSRGQRLAAIKGKVNRPFSDERSLDLEAGASFDPSWLRGLGVQVPADLRIAKIIPVRGKVTGKTDRLQLDLSGDLTPSDISWTYLRKEPGQKGALGIKGTLIPANGAERKNTQFQGQARVEVTHPALRLSAVAPWLPLSRIQADSGLSVHGSRIDFKDLRVGLRDEKDARDMLVVRGNLTGIGSSEPKIGLRATALIGGRALSLLTSYLGQDFKVEGHTTGEAAFDGTAGRMSWRLDAPLGNLDLRHKDSFRKPAGVAGKLTAAGRLAQKNLTLDEGTLTLPGVKMSGQGELIDAQGSFGSLSLRLEQTDINSLLRYIPTAGQGLAGPVKASLTLKPSPGGVLPHGSVQLLGLSYRPTKASWRLEGINGAIEVRGDSLVLPQINGHAQGLLESAFTVKGELHQVASLPTLNGSVSLSMGEGKIKLGKAGLLLDQVRLLAGTALDPAQAGRTEEGLVYKSLTGDFQFKGGKATTENLALKGPNLGMGVIGGIGLSPLNFNLLVGVHTMLLPSDALGQIPGAKDLMKKHEGLLKITGLDKELKRLGISVPGKEGQPDASEAPVKAPVTAIFRIQGPPGDSKVIPVLEAALDKQTAARLKSLMQ